MKVLHVSSGNLYGGVESLLATLSRDRACCPDMEPSFALCFQDRLSEQLAALGTPAHDLGEVQTRFPWQVWRARRRLARLLREQQPDVMVCHMPWALAIFGPVARRARLSLVFWMHDVAEGSHWIERWAARCPPDLAVCNSRFTAASLGRLLPRNTPPHTVIYCPVSAPEDGGSSAEREAVRRELGVPAHDCVFIQVGRMESYKGCALHLQALGLLADVPGWSCWIVGGAQRQAEKEFLAELQALAQAARIAAQVQFLGERHDVGRLLRAADVFCQPNLRGEPFGIVFIEALYARLPVVSTALGGAMEIVNDHCGRLVPANDPRALAEVLRGMVQDQVLRERLGGEGPARATSLCAPGKVLPRMMAEWMALVHE